TDPFTADTRAAYQVTGTVAWRPGAVTLEPKAALGRPLAPGDPAEVRAVVVFPPGQPAGELRLGLIAAQGEALVRLRRAAGRAELVSLLDPTQVVALPESGGPWVVRVQVRYGLVRVRAWRQGEPEPAAWQSTRYLGKAGWRPAAVAVLAGPDAGGTLAALEA